MSTRSSTPFGLFKVTENGLYLRDTTISNASASRHGLLPKLDGNASHFLDGTGAWTTPAGSGGSSSYTLLESRTASSSASLDFNTRNAAGQSGDTIQSDYDVYEIVFELIVPGTNNVSFYMRVSTNGGSSYLTGGSDYYYQYIAQSTTTLSGSGAVAAQIQLANSVETTANRSINGTYRLHGPGSAIHKSLSGKLNAAAASAQYEFTGGGLVLSTSALNAFQFFMSSGNIASGVIRVYGIAK